MSPGVDRAGQLEEPVGERRLPVVDVGDDAEAADAVELGHGAHSRRRHRDPTNSPGSGTRARLLACSGSADARQLTGSPMANIKSQKKRNRQNERRRAAQQGRPLRAEDPHQGRARPRSTTGADDADERGARSRRSASARPASKGVIHKNQAARRTSRLMKRAAAADGCSVPTRASSSVALAAPSRRACRRAERGEPRHEHVDHGRARRAPLAPSQVELGLGEQRRAPRAGRRCRAAAPPRARSAPGTPCTFPPSAAAASARAADRSGRRAAAAAGSANTSDAITCIGCSGFGCRARSWR